MTLHRDKLCIIFIFCVVFFVFHESLDFGFVNWDDDHFVYQNESIQKLNLSNLKKIFTTFEGACYLPLSRLSMAIDFAIWKKNPFGFHLTSIVLHGLNACLIFLITLRCFKQGFTHSSATLSKGALFAALLFALHPLRVESVSWISERKDVLASFFCLLAVLFYLLYSTRVSLKRYYVLALASYTAALLSKASVATVPLIFVLLDIYPFQRIRWREYKTSLFVLLEKIPFLFLGFVFGVIAIFGQQMEKTTPDFQALNGTQRLAVAMVSHLEYLKKIFWPVHLNPLHLLNDFYHFGQSIVWIGFLILLTISLLCFWQRSRYPVLLVTWISYLTLIMPFSGIIPVGGLLMADRYTYLASIPLAIFIGSCYQKLRDSGDPSGLKKWGLGSVLILLMTLSLKTIRQQRIWNSSETLWQHAVHQDPKNLHAWRRLGDSYLKSEKNEEALKCFRRAVQIAPLHIDTCYDLGCALGKLGKYEEAEKQYKKILDAAPDYYKAHFNLGWLYAHQNKNSEALQEYLKAHQLNPSREGLFNIACCYEVLGEPEKAEVYYERAAIQGSEEAWILWSELALRRGDSRRSLDILKRGIKTSDHILLLLSYAERVLSLQKPSQEDVQQTQKILLQLDHRTQGKSARVKDLKKKLDALSAH